MKLAGHQNIVLVFDEFVNRANVNIEREALQEDKF